MRVKTVSWSQWSSNPSNGTASCRECGAVVKGADFYEAESLDVKGRRFLCDKCVNGKAEVVADFGEGAAPAAAHPMSVLLPSHVATIRGMILGAIGAHVKTYHGAEPEVPPVKEKSDA